MIIVNGFQPSTIITKRSILHVVAVLDPPLTIVLFMIFMIDIFLFFFGFEISSVNSAGCFQNASVGNNTSFKLIFFPSCDNFNYLYDDTQVLYGRNKVSVQEITVTCIGWYYPKFVKKKQRDVFQEIYVAQVHELVFMCVSVYFIYH